MHTVTYEEFHHAVETLDLLSLTTQEEVRKKYLKLSRLYHPDMEGGSADKFREVRESYEILTKYMESFRFLFSEEEFKQQNPVLVNVEQSWLENR